MMFLEFAIRGSWSILVARHMESLGFSGLQIGWVYATFSIGALLSPLAVGWLADRHLRADHLFSVCHLLGAVTLFLAWTASDFSSFFTYILLHNIVFYPTVSLANSISFFHLEDRNTYGAVRVWGTYGWIGINLLLSAWLVTTQGHHEGPQSTSDCLLFGTVLCLIGACGAFWIPATPPPRSRESIWAFAKHLHIFKQRAFMVLVGTGIGVGICLAFVYNFTFLYFTSPSGYGLDAGPANIALTLGQGAEIACMVGLAAIIRRLSLRPVLLMGLAALWLRLLLFSLENIPLPVALAAQALHGVDYAFFIAAGAIAVDQYIPGHQRAQAQAFILLVIWGLGMLIGHLLSGWWYDHTLLSIDGPRHQDWQAFFQLPTWILTPFLVGFALLFPRNR